MSAEKKFGLAAGSRSGQDSGMSLGKKGSGSGSRARAKLKLRKGADGKGAHSFHFHGDREEAGAAIGNGVKAGHVLDDRDTSAEECGMDGPRSVIRRIDVE